MEAFQYPTRLGRCPSKGSGSFLVSPSFKKKHKKTSPAHQDWLTYY
jgi:hypothetical protein